MTENKFMRLWLRASLMHISSIFLLFYLIVGSGWVWWTIPTLIPSLMFVIFSWQWLTLVSVKWKEHQEGKK